MVLTFQSAICLITFLIYKQPITEIQAQENLTVQVTHLIIFKTLLEKLNRNISVS